MGAAAQVTPAAALQGNWVWSVSQLSWQILLCCPKHHGPRAACCPPPPSGMFLVLPNERGIQGMEIWLNRCGALERGAYASPPLALHEAAAGEEGDAPSKPIPPPPPPLQLKMRCKFLFLHISGLPCPGDWPLCWRHDGSSPAERSWRPVPLLPPRGPVSGDEEPGERGTLHCTPSLPAWP